MNKTYAVCAGIAVMLVFGEMNMPYVFLGIGAAVLAIAFWGWKPKIKFSLKGIKMKSIVHKFHKPKIKSMSESQSTLQTKKTKVHGLLKAENISPSTILTLASVFLKFGIAKKLERKMVGIIKTAIFESGTIEDSQKIAHYSISLAFLALFPSVIGGIVAGILVSPVFLTVMAVPIGFLMSGIINLRIIKSQRQSAIEHELPVFIMCASIMEPVGFNLYVFLERLSKTNTSLFPTIQKDAILFSRNTTFLAMPHEKALKKIADAHPNQKFKDLVNDYTSARTTSGASTANTMISATTSAFREMRYKIKGYTNDAQGIAQMLLIMMTTAPIMAIAISIMASGNAAFQVTLMITILMPVMSLMIILTIDGKQPRTHTTTNIAREAITIGIITAVIMAMLGRPAWEILGVSTAIFAGINTVKNMSYFRSLAKLDKAVPKFLQEVTDGMIEGMSIYESIKRKSNHPNKSLRSILVEISKKMYMGIGLVAASEKVKTQSWLSHVVFFVLGHIHESGAASANILQSFSNFTKDYEESKREMLSSLRGSVMMGYFIPVMMSFMLVISAQLVDSISGNMSSMEHLPINLPDVQDSAALTESSFFLVVLCSVLIGLVVSKIAYFTLKHTLHVCTLSLLAVILCHMVPLAPPLI